MIITYEGQQYEFDLDDITVKQGLKIEKYMGCSLAEWGKRLQGSDDPEKPKNPDLQARQVLGWLILHPNDGVTIEDTDFKMGKLGEALDAAFKAQEAAANGGREPVPTVAVLNGQPPAESSQESSPPFSGEISR